MVPALVVVASAASAQSPFAQLDSALRVSQAQGPAPAVGIAVVYHDSVVYTKVVGFTDLERPNSATLATRFDLASIAKQFTAYSVSMLVDQGLVQTTDDVRMHIPELDLGGARISVAQLLHHTAGLEDTDGLYALSGGRGGDEITHADLVRLLVHQQHLRFAPGSAHFYSNGGYTLLAEIVARRTGVPFGAWCDSAIFRPLGINNSGFLDDPRQVIPNRALPYALDRRTGAYRSSRSDTYPGAGGLFASMPDMATWMRHLLRADAPAVARLRERGVLTSGDTLRYAWGLSWGEYRGHRALGHAGSGPATAAHMLMIPDLGFGVVAAIAGDVQANPATLAFLAADVVLGDKLASRDQEPAPGQRRAMMITEEQMNARPPESEGVTVAPEQLARYTGRYRMPDGEIAVIHASGGALNWAIDGREPLIPLFPLPNGKFVAVPWWDTFRFELPAQGQATALVVEATPRSLRGASRPPAVAPRLADQSYTAETAAPYVGWYLSDELQTVYRVVLDGNRLALVHARHGRIALTPLEGDRFAANGGGIAAVNFARQGTRAVGLELVARSWNVKAALRRLEIDP